MNIKNWYVLNDAFRKKSHNIFYYIELDNIIQGALEVFLSVCER